MNSETERAIARAAQLTDELARVLGSLRSVEVEAPAAVFDVAAVERLAEGLGDRAEVVVLAASFADGLSGRVAAYVDASRAGDDGRARRLLIDLRSSSQLMGASAIVAWCRRREASEPTSEAELADLVERTRREMTVWRLTSVAFTQLPS
jgi:hypothetical protein